MNSTAQPPENENFSESDLDRIIAELAAGIGNLPRQAIREAREHRDPMVPKHLSLRQRQEIQEVLRRTPRLIVFAT